MSPTDSTHVMLVTRRPILTSVEENGTFVPSKTRIGSGRIVPRIDESRAISFCLPPASGTTSRAIREIDRLSNGYARLYPFHLSWLSSPSSSSSSSYPASYSTFRLYILVAFRFSHGTDGDLLSLSPSLSLSLFTFFLSFSSRVPIRQTFIRHDKRDLVPARAGTTRAHPYSRPTYVSKRIANFMLSSLTLVVPLIPSISTGSMKYFYRRRRMKFEKGEIERGVPREFKAARARAPVSWP